MTDKNETVTKISTADVVYREDLYPRIEKDPALVQKYTHNIELLPPIEVNQHNELIDGWHRWTAYKTEKITEIPAIVTQTTSEAHFLALACRRNATAGKQLSDPDKAKMAIRLYAGGTGIGKQEIAEALSVTLRRVNHYLSDEDAKLKQQRDEKILAMWLACHTQQEIAEAVGVTSETVSSFLQKNQNLEAFPKSEKSAILHEDGFEAQIYSIWNFGKATNEVRHFGNIPPEIIDNLLYYYTKPFDVVFDPFAGGGSTVDICRKRMRRCFASDLNPIEARKHDIRQHDITSGLPSELPVPDFVFLDPPYWKQAEKKYSNDETDLGNVELESFLDSIAKIASETKRKWSGAKRIGKLALIIGPWKHEGKELDLAYLCYQRIQKYLNPVKRVIVPYSTQVHGGAFVQKAKDRREMLYLFRDLMIFSND